MRKQLIDRLFPNNEAYRWQMELWERAVIELVARRIEPEVAIDLGTADGGSLSMIASFAKTLYSLDIMHPADLVDRIAKSFPNCHLITGDSRITLPQLLESIEVGNEALELVLIDGGHSREQVAADLSAVIRHRPKTETIIIGHDAFNPACRAGMLDVDWADSPWVIFVELDAVPGILWNSKPLELQQWGGVMIAEMTHEGRGRGQLDIGQRQKLNQRLISSHTIHEGSLTKSICDAFSTMILRRTLQRKYQGERAGR